MTTTTANVDKMTVEQRNAEIEAIEAERRELNQRASHLKKWIRIMGSNADDRARMAEFTRKDTELYNRAVTLYNANVEVHNKAVQTRRNDRERQATYNATCKKCFTIHPEGECY